jgi:hypothetical protein
LKNIKGFFNKSQLRKINKQNNNLWLNWNTCTSRNSEKKLQPNSWRSKHKTLKWK